MLLPVVGCGVDMRTGRLLLRPWRPDDDADVAAAFDVDAWAQSLGTETFIESNEGTLAWEWGAASLSR